MLSHLHTHRTEQRLSPPNRRGELEMKCMVTIKDGKLDHVLNALEGYTRVSGSMPLVRGPSGHWDSLVLEVDDADWESFRKHFATSDVEIKVFGEPDLTSST